MYYNDQPALLAKELVEKLPPHPSGEDWVVHLVNDGSESVDLAV
jgi:4-aminobutyrate aminotransferase-like enzyme